MPALLAILGDHVGCSLALVDEAGTGRRRAPRRAARLSCEHVLELPVVADGEIARPPGGEGRAASSHEYDRLVLHHGQTALAFELSRRHAVSAAELRLAGDLLEDLEHDRLDEREISRAGSPRSGSIRSSRYAGAPRRRRQVDDRRDELRSAAARVLDSRGARYLSAARRDRAAFLVAMPTRGATRSPIARELVDAAPGTRVGVGRPASGPRARTQPARGARGARRGRRRRRLLPRPRLARAAARPPERVARGVRRPRARAGGRRAPGSSSRSTALLDSGCRWSEAADRLGVHRHTLRYRMDRLRQRDRPPSRRPRAAHGALARGEGEAGAPGARAQ